jgi:hypothetical protein
MKRSFLIGGRSVGIDRFIIGDMRKAKSVIRGKDVGLTG